MAHDHRHRTASAGKCPVCGIQTEQQTVYQKWGYPIRICDDCGLGSTQILEQSDPKVIYNRGYFQGETRDGYADYAGSETVLRQEFRRTLDYLRRHGPTSGRLLEVGSAYGFFLIEAQTSFRCSGIEVADDAVRFARSRGLDMHLTELNEAFVKNSEPFDALVMLDVIEHLADPAGTLELARRALAAGGWLMITTGDWDSLLARLAGRHWRLMTPPQHLFFFSSKTLTLMLNRLGFEVVDCGKPWKRVPIGLAAHQLAGRIGIRLPFLGALNRVGIPLNLFDAIRVLARKTV